MPGRSGAPRAPLVTQDPFSQEMPRTTTFVAPLQGLTAAGIDPGRTIGNAAKPAAKTVMRRGLHAFLFSDTAVDIVCSFYFFRTLIFNMSFKISTAFGIHNSSKYIILSVPKISI